MKRILSTLFVFALLLTSCQGEDGIDGEDGGIFVASSFEIEIDFNAANNYEYFEDYGFYVYPSDVTLVYILWETADGQDVWRLMPQQVTFDEDTANESELTYNYDFTQNDVRFFLDGTVDLSAIGSEWTQNQVFRVVVIPAENVDAVDTSNIEAIMEAYRIEAFEKK
ncbi:hypothetical protein KO494_13225 [Lacinutrix sp. C3R15]|uniref:hypothetical protein n=1 Tax=Flavobacteriaceae TaxID=49546 RepID=UPI001C094147|nr:MULTISPECIES: hypothetical protein [Flavobacteriaceae]MBU2940503.1 hypothetical protein [Lacinutrix sp. C3R15]MDO6623823.1 hypothetical protein [Oceanihabitans sp. 1_MG-2023]